MRKRRRGHWERIVDYLLQQFDDHHEPASDPNQHSYTIAKRSDCSYQRTSLTIFAKLAIALHIKSRSVHHTPSHPLRQAMDRPCRGNDTNSKSDGNDCLIR
jgi:hypothetical protein